MHTQFSSIAVETFAAQVVVSLPHCEEFSAPVYNQVNQEQIAAGETTENIAEIPVVEEQVNIQDIPHAPQVVDSSPPLEDFAVQPYVPLHEFPEVQVAERIQEQIIEPIDVTPQASQMTLNTSSTSTSSASRLRLKASRRKLKGWRCLPSGCWRLHCRSLLCQSLQWWSLLWLSLTVLLRNAVDEHGTPRCPGSWKTQCTWLRVRGRLYVTPDTVHRS